MLKRNLIGQSALEQETISIFKASVALSKTFSSIYGLNWGTNKVYDEPYIIEKDIDRALSSDLFKKIFSISVVNRVPILINASSRSYYMGLKNKFVEPGSDPEVCLQKGHGSCGNQAAVGLALLWLGGIEAREIQFYYNLNGRRYSHIVPEVLIGETWRIIDTTYGAYWIPKNKKNIFDLATTEDVLGGRGQIFYNSALLPYGLLSLNPENPLPFEYLKAQSTILRGGVGEVELDLFSTKGVEKFEHLPTYLGDNKEDGLMRGVNFKLKTIGKTPIKITLVVSGSAFSDEKPVKIFVGTQQQLFSKQKNIYEFTEENPSGIYLQSNMDVAYIVLDKIEWTYIKNQGADLKKVSY